MVILTSGTAISQAILIAATPFLSRLYEPSDFGVLGLYISVVMVAVQLASMRYELAIVLPKKEYTAACVLMLAFYILIGITGLAALIFIFGRFWIANKLGNLELAYWLWLVPTSILILGLNNILNYWYVRQKQFLRLSINKILRFGVTVVMQGFAGFVGVGFAGLIGGQLAGNTTSTAMLGALALKDDKKIISRAFFSPRLKEMLKRYKDFAIYGCPTTLINSFSIHMPIFVLTYFFNPNFVGYYMLADRLIKTPGGLIGTSFRQVFLQKANIMFNESGNIHRLLKETTLVLLGIVIVPVILLSIFAPILFSTILGESWITAGIYARWIVFSVVLDIAVIPSIELTRILELQKLLLYYSICILVCRSSALILSGVYFNAFTALISYCGAGVLVNFFLIVAMLKQTKKLSKERNVNGNRL